MLKSAAEANANFYAALSFLIITLGVGLPVWWKTTEVYRAPLPYEVIEQLNATKLALKVRVSLLYVDIDLSHSLNALKSRLSAKMGVRKVHERLNLHFEFEVSHIEDEYKILLASSDGIDSFDSKHGETTKMHSDVNVVFLTFKHNAADVQFGNRHNVYVRWNETTVDRAVERCLLEFQFDERKLSEILGKHFDKRPIGKTKPSRRDKAPNLASKIPSPAPSSEYSVEFTVISPDSALNVRQVDEIRTFVRFGLTPLSTALHNLTRLHFKSQILHFVDFEHAPKFDRSNNGSGSFYYESVALPHLISGLESYTGSFETDRAVLKFLLYIAPKTKRPLYVLNERGARSTGNGFVVTNWGGVLVLNPAAERSASFVLDKEARDALYTQILRLLGFSVARDWPISRRPNPLPLWDVRRLTYEATLDYCTGTIATLLSLNKLLAEITNIVISDHVSSAIDISVREVKRSIALLDDFPDRETLNDAFSSAKIAREQSEKAFFDPSLLSLLYFPDDQKYAIYVPLFLPVLLPVFVSVFSVVRYFRRNV